MTAKAKLLALMADIAAAYKDDGDTQGMCRMMVWPERVETLTERECAWFLNGLKAMDAIETRVLH